MSCPRKQPPAGHVPAAGQPCLPREGDGVPPRSLKGISEAITRRRRALVHDQQGSNRHPWRDKGENTKYEQDHAEPGCSAVAVECGADHAPHICAAFFQPSSAHDHASGEESEVDHRRRRVLRRQYTGPQGPYRQAHGPCRRRTNRTASPGPRSMCNADGFTQPIGQRPTRARRHQGMQRPCRHLRRGAAEGRGQTRRECRKRTG
jgi:hypothetical protein